MKSIYAALTANTVKRFALTGPFDFVDVVNVDNAGTAPIYFTIAAAAVTGEEEATLEPVDPTVAGNDTWVVPAGVGSTKRVRVYGKNVVVKCISAGTALTGVVAGNKGDEV